ncbi:MAG: DUF72 domain-containing protein [Nitrososphaerales archaeon]
MATFHIGCSGWSYADWVGPFYPKGTKPGDYLQKYSSVFDSVEIDSSFYRIPNQFMISQWKKNTPENFLFCPKFPKKITHELKLQNVSDTLSFFSRTLAGLGSKLGPMVVQLPPSFKYDSGMKHLESFLSELKTGFRYSIEFRHKSWFRDDVFSLLEKNNVALCWSINQYTETPRKLTASFIYARMVGEDRQITNFSEIQKDTESKMKQVADEIKGSTDDAFVFFNNHFAGFGPESVNEFRRLLGLIEMNFSQEKQQTSLGEF